MSVSLLSQTEQTVAFSDNPIIVGVNISAGHFPASAIYRTITIRVSVNGLQYPFTTTTNNNEQHIFDISSAFRAVFQDNQASPDKVIGKSYVENAIQGVVDIYTQYNTTSSTDNHNTLITSYNISVIRGGISESKRYLLNVSKPSAVISSLSGASLSTKPTTGEVRNYKDYIIKSTLNSGYSRTVQCTQDTTSEKNRNRHEFFFLNSFGCLESVSAECLESKTRKFFTEEYNQETEPSFIPRSSRISIVTDEADSWTMSSGHCTQEWADWWTNEFLVSRKHWMKLYKDDGTAFFLPVVIKPEDKYTIYDKAKPSIPSVKFTVTAAIKGYWDINKNADKYLTP